MALLRSSYATLKHGEILQWGMRHYVSIFGNNSRIFFCSAPEDQYLQQELYVHVQVPSASDKLVYGVVVMLKVGKVTG